MLTQEIKDMLIDDWNKAVALEKDEATMFNSMEEYHKAQEEQFSLYDLEYKPLSFFSFMKEGIKMLSCNHTNLKDEGYATPDSGCIDIVCEDCGFSFGPNILY